jgi:integrase
MPREIKPVRGVFENPPGSGVWWVNYYVKGKRHREKVGTRGAAIDLYRVRKADARRGLKLPELQPGKVVLFGHLTQDAVDYAKTHLRTFPDYEAKQRNLNDDFAGREAAEIQPQDIDGWLSKHYGSSPATANRYKAFFSLCYRLGIENGKVKENPARRVRHRRENNERLRFLSREEYKKLVGIIQRDHPKQLPSFVVSVYTGMRWSEQFSLTWSQVDLDRSMIRLDKTKNGSARNVPLNSVALEALKQQESKVPHNPKDKVFPLPGPESRWYWWLRPCLDEAKIADYVWHSNRHTFCSWLAMAGVSIKEIQVLAGHKTITMAARYSHLSPDAAASASERLAAIA